MTYFSGGGGEGFLIDPGLLCREFLCCVFEIFLVNEGLRVSRDSRKVTELVDILRLTREPPPYVPEGEISPALLSMLDIRVMGWSTTTDILDFLADELSPSSPSLALTLVLDPSPIVFVSPGKYSFLVA